MNDRDRYVSAAIRFATLAALADDGRAGALQVAEALTQFREAAAAHLGPDSIAGSAGPGPGNEPRQEESGHAPGL